MTLIQKEVTGVYLWTSEEKADMQGPCPEGFHVPLSSEWVALCGIFTSTFGLTLNPAAMGTYLKMPMAGFRRYSDADVSNVGSRGYYRASTPYDTDNAENLFFYSSHTYPQTYGERATGFSVRGFKDTPTIPTSSWATLYQGTGSAGVFWNIIDGLISVSGDGQTWYTIMDKNLGATTVYNQGDALTDANCGYFYQWGNNYGFPHSGSVTTSSTQVDVTGYGPGNYYSSSTFIIANPRNSTTNDNLRGGVTQQTGTVLVEHKVRPTYKPRTFTITRTEQSNMSSGWTYSDDAAGLTAGDGAFDDFFGYSAVLLNTSGVETAEMTQSGGVFTGAMTTLGNITSGDNVMIKFPVRGIKMSKSGSTVTLSITDEPNKDGYQYYAFQNTGDIESNTVSTTTKPMYLGAYLSYNNSNTMKSWSGKTPTDMQTIGDNLTYSSNNGVGYTIMGWYQKCLISAYYMMKYGNPNAKNVIGLGYTGGSGKTTTGGTNSQTSATYGTSSGTVQCKLFGLEDRWGNIYEWVGGAFTDSSRNLYVALHDFTNSISTSQSQYKNAGAITNGSYYNMSSILGTNKGMFGPTGTVNNSSYNTYYCSSAIVNTSSIPFVGDIYYAISRAALGLNVNYSISSTGYVGSRLMYL